MSADESSKILQELAEKDKSIGLLQDALKQRDSELLSEKKHVKALQDEIAKLRSNGAGSPQSHPKVLSLEDDEEEDLDASAKINHFLKLSTLKQPTVNAVQLHSVNSLMSTYHILYNKELDDNLLDVCKKRTRNTDGFEAQSVSFHYSLEFFKQIFERRKKDESEQNFEYTEESYPVNWLLGIFPLNIPAKDVQACDLLPVHFALAVDTSNLPYDDYLQHLNLLLHVYGKDAFQEELSPLCVAVSKSHPAIEAVQALIDFRPSCVQQEDEDGSLAIMHACAYNRSTEVVELLYHSNPDSIHKTDNFSCSAIHYAAFSGCTEVVELLLRLKPKSAFIAEGNGALPLHDAVQNTKLGDGAEELVELLLKANPQAVFASDDYGAKPLHKAAKSASMSVVRRIHEAYPKAIFLADKEGLLPLHYYSQRSDKTQNIEVIQYLLAQNLHSTIIDEAAAATASSAFRSSTMPRAPGADNAEGGGWMGKAMKSFASWSNKGTTTNATNTTTSAASAASAGKPPQNRRKSNVIGKSGVHAQYK